MADNNRYELSTIPLIDEALLPDQAPYFLNLKTKGLNWESVGGLFKLNQIDVFNGSPTAAKNDLIDQLINLDHEVKEKKPFDLDKMKHLAVKTVFYEGIFADELKDSMQATSNSGSGELMNEGPDGKSSFFDVMQYSKALLKEHLDAGRLGNIQQLATHAATKPGMKK